jgi:two-component system, cell cycle sensor histidine kinase and response regulator CckA
MNPDINSLILNVATDGFWDWDLKIDRVSLSPHFLELLGYSPDNTIFDSQFFKTIIHPDDHSHVFSRLEECLQGKCDISVAECRMISKDGTSRWIEGRGKIVEFDEQGTPARMVGIIIDITRRKQAEAESERFSKFFQTSSDLLCIVGPNGALIETNRAWTETLGYSETELVAKPFTEFIHPEDKQSTLDEMARQMQNGTSLGFENRCICKDGSVRWLSWRATYTKVEGITYAIAQNITEHKKNEQALRNERELLHKIYDTIPVMMVKHHPHIKEFSVNHEFERIVGYSNEDIRNIDLMEECYPDPYYRKFAAEFMSSLKSEWADFTIRTKKGKNIETIWTNISISDRTHIGIGIDITDRKQSEDLLKKQIELDQWITAIAATAPVVIYSFRLRPDGSMCLPYASPQIKDIYGLTPEDLEIDAAPFFALLHPDDIGHVQETIHESARTMTPWRDEFRILHAVKGEVWVQGNSTPHLEADGSILWFGFSTDITERKQMQVQLEQSLSLLRATLESTADGILVVDSNGRFTSYNKKFQEMWGIPDSVLQSGADEQALAYVLDKLLDPEAFIAGVRALYEQPEAESYDVVKFKDGRLFERYSQPQRIDDRIMGRVWSFRDVTGRNQAEEALQESEKRFRTLCDFAPIGIFRADSEANNIYCNQRWEEITGISAAQANGKGWLEAIPPEDREELTRVWLKAVDGGQIYSHEHRQLTPQGKTIWVRALASPIKGQDGKILGHVGTLEDITELRQARQEMIKTQKLESLGLLAGGIAHDFNNILTAILGNISLARIKLHDPEKATKRLEEAENAASRAKDLTQQLLTFARGGEPVKKIVEVNGLLKEAAGFALHGANVDSLFVLADDLWLVEADEGQLCQVIHNLVINAVQAMPEGGTVTLGAENSGSMQDGQGFVRIFVTDTGAGIPEQHLQRIFDPFFTTKQQGSGLGLATCYSIIKRHGGNIAVTSTLGKGSTFYVSLPASEQGRAAVSGARTEVVHGSGRVLVMDDEEPVREAAYAMLEELGYLAECAENGNAAIDLYRQRKEEGTPFTAVIMDLTIPGGMGGREAIASLLKIDPDVKAVVSSGYSTDPVMADYRKYGFSAVLGKPYRLQEMSKVLQELLNITYISHL